MPHEEGHGVVRRAPRAYVPHNVQNVDVARITGASETAVRAWLSGKRHVPPSVERLLLIVLGEARPEDYR